MPKRPPPNEPPTNLLLRRSGIRIRPSQRAAWASADSRSVWETGHPPVSTRTGWQHREDRARPRGRRQRRTRMGGKQGVPRVPWGTGKFRGCHGARTSEGGRKRQNRQVKPAQKSAQARQPTATNGNGFEGGGSSETTLPTFDFNLSTCSRGPIISSEGGNEAPYIQGWEPWGISAPQEGYLGSPGGYGHPVGSCKGVLIYILRIPIMGSTNQRLSQHAWSPASQVGVNGEAQRSIQ